MKDIVAGLITTAVGIIALLIALGFGAERAWFFSRAQPATGVVVALQKNRFGNTSRAGMFPIIEFSTKNGQKHRFEGSSSYPPRYLVGEYVDMYFVPEDPSDARLDDFVELWLAITVSGGLSTLFLPMGAVLLFLGLRHRRLQALRTQGVTLLGTVIHAQTSSVENWGKTVQYLTVEAIDPATGAPSRFKSHGVPGKGDQWLGKQLRVFVDPKNPKRFLVDAPKP